MSIKTALLASCGGTPDVYVDDVFSTYTYTGNGGTKIIDNGIALGDKYGGVLECDGATTYAYAASNTAFASGSGAFTAECWFNRSADGSNAASLETLIETRTQDTTTTGFVVGTNSAGQIVTYGFPTGTSFVSRGAYTANVDNHLRVCSTGTTGYVFLNGTQIATFSTSGTNYADGGMTIGCTFARTGYFFRGTISNVRYVKGTCLSTANFTPDTSPLTAVSGTSILTLQYPIPTVDNSSNHFTVNISGKTFANIGPFSGVAAKGGLVWIKTRNSVSDHSLFDTVRGVTKYLASNSNTSQTTDATGLVSFGASGFQLNSALNSNRNTYSHVAWTFAQADRFFKVVPLNTATTYNHNLGVLPGCIMIKEYGASGASWVVYHKDIGSNYYLNLNTTAAQSGSSGWLTATTTQFTINNTLWDSGSHQGIAYVFGHDTSSSGLIQCGSYTGNGGNQDISLGWEPQWVLIKASSVTANWIIFDTIRGMPYGTASATLYPASTAAEATSASVQPTPTGFTLVGTGGNETNGSTYSYVYIAIRRSNKPPTSGTQVFNAVTRTNGSANAKITGAGFVPDLYLLIDRPSTFPANPDRLGYRVAGPSNRLDVLSTNGYMTDVPMISYDQDGYTINGTNNWNDGSSYVDYYIRQAVGVYTYVPYTGTGSATSVTHQLGATPEMMWIKRTDANSNWLMFTPGQTANQLMILNSTGARYTDATYFPSLPSASTFSVGTGVDINATNGKYIASLFATKAGVSKCGTYTGNGSAQTINCGFTTGARFIFIACTSTTGDRYIWDSARGIVAGNDPHKSLNTSAAEVTTDDSIDPDSTGFIVNQVAATNINVNAATYIYLAFA